MMNHRSGGALHSGSILFALVGLGLVGSAYSAWFGFVGNSAKTSSTNNATKALPPPERIASLPNHSCATGYDRRLNASELLSIIRDERSAAENGSFFVVSFYSANCPYSKKLAPLYTALPGAFPTVPFYKFNAAKETRLNLRFGIFGFPTLLCFQRGAPSKRFDGTYTIGELVTFVQDCTNVTAESGFNYQPPAEAAATGLEEAEPDLMLYLSYFVTAALPLEWLCRRLIARWAPR